ncbi:hypothetical protein ACFONG_02765 [Uliginosibacterium paludis]|uniref:Secreted protein n=1 Tax=Uliginosibacterium paludis TaxID=1615952 RepID=A0ABV2CP67_9RHOO
MINRSVRYSLSTLALLGVLVAHAQQAAPKLSLDRELAREFARSDTPAVDLTPDRPAASSPLAAVGSARCEDAAGPCAVKSGLKLFNAISGTHWQAAQRKARCAGINTPDDCQRMR